MREPERDLGRLMDILQAANHIQEFTDGLSIETLSIDKLRYFAVVKNVEIIGECAMSSYTAMRQFFRSYCGRQLCMMSPT